ncbi:hypothetical protein BU61_1982 [Pontoporia blainvillei]|uniref:Uncharacterized protein n=1 Tax=Pontoporia blainvillei TaxID=48723 RepID=A0ABX0S6E1_PONBL|nr:hypothetical protein [Pontoporia blainvillei]
MEALEVDDISPALEVTEDFFSTFDSKLEKAVQQAEVYGIQEVPELVGHEVLSNIDNGAIRNVSSLGKGGMIWDHCKTRFLETKAQNVFPAKEQCMVQKGTTPDNLSWMEQKEASTFDFFNICQRRRDRPRSVNDLLDETSTFKPGHARSRSDISQVDWRVVLKTMPLQQQQQPSLQGPHFTRTSFLLSSSNKVEDAQGNMEGYCFGFEDHFFPRFLVYMRAEYIKEINSLLVTIKANIRAPGVFILRIAIGHLVNIKHCMQ